MLKGKNIYNKDKDSVFKIFDNIRRSAQAFVGMYKCFGQDDDNELNSMRMPQLVSIRLLRGGGMFLKFFFFIKVHAISGNSDHLWVKKKISHIKY